MQPVWGIKKVPRPGFGPGRPLERPRGCKPCTSACFVTGASNKKSVGAAAGWASTPTPSSSWSGSPTTALKPSSLRLLCRLLLQLHHLVDNREHQLPLGTSKREQIKCSAESQTATGIWQIDFLERSFLLRSGRLFFGGALCLTFSSSLRRVFVGLRSLSLASSGSGSTPLNQAWGNSDASRP